ncbi:MAG TPA: PEP-CTERM sorting domain-containing protein, partial [Bryobacteraceae bacterium]|nr:PEP-CTERM sorting domain-containing protein [Bryobacteraceae bacterium]
VTMSAFRDTSNAVLPPTLGTTSEIATTQIFTPGAVSATVSGSFSPTTDPYSLTQQIVINTTGAGLFSLDFLLSPVPEPASVLFLGTVLLICFKALRRRTNVA